MEEVEEEESLTVLGGSDLSAMVYEHLLAVAAPLFERAAKRRRALGDPQSVASYQKMVRERFVRLLGGLPDRTPLNPRTTATLSRPGYQVEKIIFESRPQFYVPANFYYPAARREPAPAVLVLCGHKPAGKASEDCQRVAQGLVRNGFAVLLHDPLGCGERSQYWDRLAGRSRLGPAVSEGEVAGAQSKLVGVELAAYHLWDATRALDYLCLRDAVDVTRLGVTGCGPGGLLALALFALDERLRAAVPVCAVTSHEAWLAAGLRPWPEQPQHGIIAEGIDYADLCIAGAPRPLRLGAAERDFLPIEGTRATFHEVKRLYALMGAGDCADLVVAEGPGRYTRPLREAAYQWFNLWLGDPSADPSEPPTAPQRPEELACVPGGQVAELGSRTVFCFTRQLAEALPPEPPPLTTRGEAEQWQNELRGRLRDLLRCPASSGAPPVDQHGVFFRGKCGIERLSFKTERGITVPALLFVPEKAEKRWPGILYVHELGKEAEAGHRGTIGMLAGEGNVVLAIDVRGVGESRPALAPGAAGPERPEGYYAPHYAMVGRSMVGRRVHDVLRSLALLAERPEVDPERLSIVGQGTGGLLALFAAALEERVATAVCCQSLASYRLVAAHEFHSCEPWTFVHALLRLCDLPQVAACVAPRRLVLAGPVDHMGRRLTGAEAAAVWSWTRRVYRLFEAEDRFVVSTTGELGEREGSRR